MWKFHNALTFFGDFFAGELSSQTLGILQEYEPSEYWEHTSLRNGHFTKQLVELLIISDCELNITRYHTALLVVTGRISSQLKYFGSSVFQYKSEYTGAPAPTRVARLPFFKKRPMIVPTGNWSPALVSLLLPAFFPSDIPRPTFLANTLFKWPVKNSRTPWASERCRFDVRIYYIWLPHILVFDENRICGKSKMAARTI